MPKEPNYYDILGLRPEADAAAIEAAYRGRSLRFRVGEGRIRGAEQTGPTQEQIEQAYAILGDPESRALYDAVYFPAEQPPVRRRRIPIWLGALIGVWLVALLAVVLVGLRNRTQADSGVSGRIAGQTAAIVAGGGASATITITPAGGAVPGGSPTTIAALPPMTATSTVPAVTATAMAPTATAAVAPTAVPSATSTIAPTATVGPTNTATTPPPTATAPAPTIAAVPPTPVPPTATPEPVPTALPPTAAPEPEPTATPSFRATDRIGTALSVNLRVRPGTASASLGLLPTGTLLQATGETERVSGQLWRRFVLQDGRVGWVRDLDVFPAR